MRASLRRLASSVTSQPLKLQEASASLLPPLPLFRRILRAHRMLPLEMRLLGDDYVKSEWKLYLDQLESAKGTEFRGKPLDPTLLESMSAEQIGQLYELMHATRDIWKKPEELGEQKQERK
ncbi:acetate non-utilizing protein 9 [Tulasnella sp. UAMH 9824]|nr:acetate non-utilizing protein 9 [Tulasnella sp. UAMH 9824]